MLKTVLAAFGLVLAAGVAGCSGSNAVDNGATTETNLSNFEDLPANDALLSNDAAFTGDALTNDGGVLNGADLDNVAAPVGNAAGNSAL